MSKKLNGTVIVTYRCNARCNMCNRFKAPSRPEDEISIETIKKLPEMYFTNSTGGEPFIREDIKDIVRELRKKSDRIVISTNGFFTDKIIDLCKEFPDIGIRISIEGLEQTNNEIRGLQDGFNRGYTTLKKLEEEEKNCEAGLKDVRAEMGDANLRLDQLTTSYHRDSSRLDSLKSTLIRKRPPFRPVPECSIVSSTRPTSATMSSIHRKRIGRSISGSLKAGTPSIRRTTTLTSER